MKKIMSIIGDLFREFKASPLKAMARWQNYRIAWFLMGGTALLMNLMAHYIFQLWMELDPCELCVYIRFSMFTIFFGSMIAAINPKNNILRWVGGYIVNTYGIIQGLIWDIRLENIHLMLDRLKDETVDLFAVGGGAGSCSMDPVYPLNLPLHEWFPSWFLPTGPCGEVDWYLFGFNMAECLFLFYGIYIIAMVLMIVSWFKYKNSVNSERRS